MIIGHLLSYYLTCNQNGKQKGFLQSFFSQTNGRHRLKSLTIIGCGTVGQTLAKLWYEKGVFSIGAILNPTLDSGLEAKEFIGAGRVAEDFYDLRSTDVWLIATPDDLIAESCTALANTGVLAEGNLVFHASGAHTSANLGPAWASRALTASLHPIKSFLAPKSAVETFDGTYCTFEGVEEAQEILEPAVTAIGGNFLSVKAENKPLYHAGTSILCNHLCSVVDFGLSALDRAGVNKTVAIKAVEPILRETMENVLRVGGIEALTGPIARGDVETVRKQTGAIKTKLPERIDIFKALSILTSEVSEAKGVATLESLEKIDQILNEKES